MLENETQVHDMYLCRTSITFQIFFGPGNTLVRVSLTGKF